MTVPQGWPQRGLACIVGLWVVQTGCRLTRQVRLSVRRAPYWDILSACRCPPGVKKACTRQAWF